MRSTTLTRHLTTGWHVALFGSTANNGATASTFYWTLNNASWYRGRNIGTQLAVATVQHETPATVCGKYGNPITLGSCGEQRGEHQR